MKGWWKRIRAALGLGLIWGLGWGLVGGFIMEGFIDPQGRIADMWPQGLAFTGFFAGLFFSALLWLAEGRRSLTELSMARVGLWGALSGALLVGAGLLTGLDSGFLALALAPVTVTSAVSATGSLALARVATGRFLGAGKAREDLRIE